MSKTNNDGQAFPSEGGFDSGLHPHPGMTLRDYFAAKAMNGLLAGKTFQWGETHEYQQCAQKAFAYADAMLAEKARREQETAE